MKKYKKEKLFVDKKQNKWVVKKVNVWTFESEKEFLKTLTIIFHPALLPWTLFLLFAAYINSPFF